MSRETGTTMQKRVRKNVTIRDVAKRAGVTPAIVSRVFNQDKTLSIREDTRKAVISAIKELNYTPNSIARSLRTQTSHTVGFMVSDISNPFFTDVIKGIQTEAARRGYSVYLFDTGDDTKREKQYIERLRSMVVDGIILGSSYIEDTIIQDLEELQIKYVMVNRGSTNSNAPYVKNDEYMGTEQIMDYLFSLGHTRIAHLSGPLYADTAIRRLSMYRKKLNEQGIPYRNGYVIETMYTEESGYAACEELLKQEELPTAIFAANDLVAIGAMEALRAHGLHVPEDMSVAGFNDIWISSRIFPALTTARCDMKEMGRLTFTMLYNMIEGEKIENPKIVLPTELIIRDSCRVLS